MSVLIFLVVLYILNTLTLRKVFEKAGVSPNKALIPGVAAVEWCKLIGQKPSHAAWLLFPIVNIFTYAGMCIDLVRSFGKFGFGDAVLSVVYAPISFFRIGNDASCKYNGPVLEQEKAFHESYKLAKSKDDKLTLRKLDAQNPYKKSQFREWSEAIIFAVFAAAFIRMFLIEAYVIPTSSMEGTLKVGDFLFVSKAHYGIRTPMTVLQFPLVHNRFSQSTKFKIIGALLDNESYLESPSLPYFRLPALESIDRNDPVVFNYPEGDSVIIRPERTYSIYDFRRMGFPERELKKLDVITRPIDKMDHYIKRCIAVSGDTLQIKDRQVFINGAAVQNPTNMQFSYQITPSINNQKLDALGVSITDNQNYKSGFFNLDKQQVEKIRAFGGDIKVELDPKTAIPRNDSYLFPHDTAHYKSWTVDNYGPIWIPKKGATTVLTPENIAFYERIIRVYENNTLEIKGGKFYINGAEATSYTFKQNYYWMMGDNRHNSEDSRVWGYVPEDHVVGKPLFIWFSTKQGNFRNGINWSRIFSSASKL